MRKLFAMLTVVALATGMTACSDDDGTETVSYTHLTLPTIYSV